MDKDFQPYISPAGNLDTPYFTGSLSAMSPSIDALISQGTFAQNPFPQAAPAAPAPAPAPAPVAPALDAAPQVAFTPDETPYSVGVDRIRPNDLMLTDFASEGPAASSPPADSERPTIEWPEDAPVVAGAGTSGGSSRTGYINVDPSQMARSGDNVTYQVTPDALKASGIDPFSVVARYTTGDGQVQLRAPTGAPGEVLLNPVDGSPGLYRVAATTTKPAASSGSTLQWLGPVLANGLTGIFALLIADKQTKANLKLQREAFENQIRIADEAENARDEENARSIEDYRVGRERRQAGGRSSTPGSLIRARAGRSV